MKRYEDDHDSFNSYLITEAFVQNPGEMISNMPIKDEELITFDDLVLDEHELAMSA